MLVLRPQIKGKKWATVTLQTSLNHTSMNSDVNVISVSLKCEDRNKLRPESVTGSHKRRIDYGKPGNYRVTRDSQGDKRGKSCTERRQLVRWKSPELITSRLRLTVSEDKRRSHKVSHKLGLRGAVNWQPQSWPGTAGDTCTDDKMPQSCVRLSHKRGMDSSKPGNLATHTTNKEGSQSAEITPWSMAAWCWTHCLACRMRCRPETNRGRNQSELITWLDLFSLSARLSPQWQKKEKQNKMI